MNKAAMPGLAATILVVACGTEPSYRKNEVTNAHWTKGDTLWLRVVSTDSAFSTDSLNEIRRKEIYVRLVVLATGTAASVEWQEFGLMTAEWDSATTPGSGHFFPSTRLVYACAKDGTIDRLTNFQELRAYSDTMLNIYLAQVGTLPPGMKEKLLAWGLDSVRLIEQVLTDPELFHRSFGLTLTDSSDLHAELDLLDPAVSPIRYRIERTRNTLCDPTTHVSFRGSIEVDTVDIKQLMIGTDLLKPMMDTMGPAQEPVHVKFDVCFDTVSSMPAYVEQTMTSRMWGYDIKKTTVIYRDERIAH